MVQRPSGGTPGDGAMDGPFTPDDTVQVPGAERTVTVWQPDLSTAGLLQAPVGRFTDRSDWISLHAPGTSNPNGVPGLQVDGYFPDTSTFNTTHGWNQSVVLFAVLTVLIAARSGASRMAVSRGGDWTARFIADRPDSVWVRGVPTAGVVTVARQLAEAGQDLPVQPVAVGLQGDQGQVGQSGAADG